MNSFASYGNIAAPRAPKPRKEPSALDLKMEEKQRLSKAYKADRRKRRAALIEGEPRIRDFMRYLRKIKAEDAAELIDAVASSWIPTSPKEVRYFVLELVQRQSDKINRALGLPVFCDPIPPETNVYHDIREILFGGAHG